MTFIDPRKTPFVNIKSCGELPHLYKPLGTYFVTFRLFDAVVHNPMPEIDLDDPEHTPEQITSYYDPPIILGSCVLRDPQIAKIVQTTILHFEALKY